MGRQLFWPSVASVLVTIAATAAVRAQVVAKPSLLGSASSQPAAVPALAPASQAAAAPTAAPASQMKRPRPGVPLETLVRVLDQTLGQAVSAETAASASGWDPERPDQLRNDLASYQESRQLALTAARKSTRQRYAAEAASKLSSLQTSVAQSKSDVASLRASQTFYSKAKMILDSNPDIGDDAIRQDVGKKILELQDRVPPLHNAVTHVGSTLTRERQQQQTAESFAKQKGPPPFDPSGTYGVDPWGRPYIIRR